ncbi:PAN domain-containing protein [Rhizobium leguminosarum]|uniref:PAN domain-containing protein n=1 Tax=Rhizobium leguminosarum TaxID=384 RepID=UPI003F9DEC8D
MTKNIARLLLAVSVMAVPCEQAGAEELFRYPDTVLRGTTSAELPLSLQECRKVCLARSGCGGFEHSSTARTCRMFASVDSAVASSGYASETRVPIAGYRDPLDPPTDVAELCADKAGPKLGSKGADYEGVNVAAAIKVCEKAATAAAPKPETFAYYARALQKAGRATEALDWAKRSADAGSAAGQWFLGTFYDSDLGKVVEEDDKKAAYLYRQSADQGYPVGQYNLAVFLQLGRGGLEKNQQQAARLFRMAADQGYAAAFFHLGIMYETGRGVPKDKTEAVRLYRLAAQSGVVGAEGRVVVMCGRSDEVRRC